MISANYMVENIVVKGENDCYQHCSFSDTAFERLPFQGSLKPRPGGSVVSVSDSWPGGCVRSQVEVTLLSSVFSPLTSAEACEKSSRRLWKEKLC